MKISFFEEFPTKENLSKLDLIDFPTKIYLADYHIDSFKQYEKEIKSKNKHVKELIWWPVLNYNEGYWLSPYSKRKALLRLFHSLLNQNIPILWDCEFPIKRHLVFTQFFKSFKNKKLIKAFFKKYQGKVYTAEYILDSKFLNFNCLIFDPNIYNNTKIKMMYSSMHLWLTENEFKNKLEYFKSKYGDKFFASLGVLDIGIQNKEKAMSPELLERDLRLCKEAEIKEVVIYRLGGLNKEYLRVIKKFI